MNELELIMEVQKHAVLYDKAAFGFNKTKLRDNAWKAIEDELTVSEIECKKRWRSLRDSFIKQQRTHGGFSRWPYYQAMQFLLPHLEPKSEHVFIKAETESSEPDEEAPRNLPVFPARPAAPALPTLSSLPSLPAVPDVPDLSVQVKSEEEQERKPSTKKERVEYIVQQIPNPDDSNENFLLSFAPALQRMSPKRNAIARLKIQHILYDIEFGSGRNLPFVTPASEFEYESMEEPFE